MREYYDIVIIGAGPAGLNAALHAVKRGPKTSILLVDKTAPWERTMQCAEAVGRQGFEEAVEVQPHWIRQTITRATFHAPSGVTVTYAEIRGGYIIDRAAMQRDIAADLATRGVVCRFDRRVEHISGMKDFRRTVEFADGAIVHGRVIVDAAGPAATLGRSNALLQKPPPDLEPACAVIAEGVALDNNAVHLYMTREFAPGGYAWVFPRANQANIGIVIGAQFKGKVNIRRLLDAFLDRYFAEVTIVDRFAGCIPCARGRLAMAVPGLLRAGDAASTVHPISRAGITEALLCGELAGDHAVQMLSAGNEHEMHEIAKRYEAAWRKARGRKYEKFARVKPTFAEVPDEDYSRAADSLVRTGAEFPSMFQIFRAALGRFPRLLWALRHMV